MLLKQLTIELIDKLINEIKKNENIEKMKLHLVDPIIDYTFHRLYPYILISSAIFLLTFLLALAIFLLIINSYIKKTSL